ncbi:MAG: hypothetical protein ACMG6E_01295 [Candidatus Roizmanbacteria bacterium]
MLTKKGVYLEMKLAKFSTVHDIIAFFMIPGKNFYCYGCMDVHYGRDIVVFSCGHVNCVTCAASRSQQSRARCDICRE